jgi:hypothetical protein
MYSIDLYYNHCVLEPLGQKLHTKMNTFKTIHHLLVYSSNHQNSQVHFEWFAQFVYILIILLSKYYTTNRVERLTQIYLNIILVYSSFVSFGPSFQPIPKYTKIFRMMSSRSWYYNIFLFEPLWYKLRIKMNINALKTEHLMSIYSSFTSFVTLFYHTKSPKFTKSFWMMSPISLYYNRCVLDLF